ncbi:hypothetical protein DYB31_014952, partial [Aphanomyces astaci]
DSPDDGVAALEAFSARVRALVLEHDIDLVYNADQTGVNYEYLPTKTLNTAGDKTVWVKCGGKTKERVTAMLLADSNGTKLPLFLVLRTAKSKVEAVVKENLTQRHGFGKTVWQSVEPMQGQNNSQIYGNPTAWWNSTISLAFLKFHFGQRADRATKKVLLLWDDFSAHFTDDVVAYAKEINVLLERIPPRYTWICQSADVAWNRPLKKCCLVDGEPVEEVVSGGVVDDTVLSELMAASSIQETIDPDGDICNGDDSVGDGTDAFE